MRDLAVQLTDQQSRLVHLLVNHGKSVEEAGALAGYAPTSAYHAIKRPAVAAAIHEAIQLDIVTIGAPLAYRIAKSLMINEKVSDRVRADLSIKILDRAGHIVPSNRQSAPQKALSEMTREEMLALIDRNQAEVERIERELAAAAKDVSAPAIAPKAQLLDAKPLNYLD